MTFSQREFRQIASRALPGLGDTLEKQFLKSPERHARKCIICHHPERAAIDVAFMEWRATGEIASQFHLADQRTLFRHAHATGLFELRAARITYAAITLADRASLESRTGDASARLRAIQVAGKSRARTARRAKRANKRRLAQRPTADAVSRRAVEIEPANQPRITAPNVPLISNRHYAMQLETIATL